MIITIDREFGSGGRELGKRLADALKISYYDQDVINEAAKLHHLSLEQIERIDEADIRKIYPHTIGRRFAMPSIISSVPWKTLLAQQNTIKQLAKQGDCVVVDHCADVTLKEFSPLSIFVYADEKSKMVRCIPWVKVGESQKDILYQMWRIDRERAAYRGTLADNGWGKKKTYRLYIDTSEQDIKPLIPSLVSRVEQWFYVASNR